MKRIVFGFITGGIWCLIWWGVLTDGWSRPLWTSGKIAFGFAASVAAELFLIIELIRSNILLRMQCSPGFVKQLEKREALCDEKDELIDKLYRQLAAMEGKSNMNEEYLRRMSNKLSDRQGASILDETNSKFVSPDGMSRAEKDRKAFEMSKEGMSNEDIADELNLSVGGIKSYISRGRKYYKDHPKEIQKDGNELHLKYYSDDEEEKGA